MSLIMTSSRKLEKKIKSNPVLANECVKTRILSNLLKDWYSENTKLHGEL